MSKYEELKKEIIKACPSIMELKFGCEIKYKFFDDVVYSGTMISKYHVSHIQVCDVYDIERLQPIEIIGRPIQIQDVLRAIYKTRNDNEYAVDLSGNFMKFDSGNPDDEFDTFEHTKYWWNNSKDLEHQEPEVIDFLYSLLTN